MASADCAACKEQFSGVTGFDAHQDRDYPASLPSSAVPRLRPGSCGTTADGGDSRWTRPGALTSHPGR